MPFARPEKGDRQPRPRWARVACPSFSGFGLLNGPEARAEVAQKGRFEEDLEAPDALAPLIDLQDGLDQELFPLLGVVRRSGSTVRMRNGSMTVFTTGV
jgi:hypothetical protein